ncbi:MAG: ABC transporter ATP-binding protein, partial [Bacteroidota bacterium]
MSEQQTSVEETSVPSVSGSSLAGRTDSTSSSSRQAGSALALRGVSYQYEGTERPAVDEVSFTVPVGSLFGLLGANGSGKSTLMSILATLRQPAAGHVWVEGVDLSVQPDVIRSRIGVAFQQPALDRHLSVRENLRLHGAMLGVPARDLPNRIEAVLADFRLADRADDSVGTLSGGLTRRADLARALLAEPSVLLLDEPTTGLDPVARAEFWDILSRLRAQRNLTILVSTHLMDEAERCNHLALLD